MVEGIPSTNIYHIWVLRMQIHTGDYLSIHQIKVGNRVSSIPVDYSISMSENYNNMFVLLDSLNYNYHNWMIF